MNDVVHARTVRAAMENPTMPALPDTLPTLKGPDGRLVHAGPAGSGVFSLTGRRACAWGLETRGLEQVRAGGWTVLSGFASELGPAASVVVGPSSVRREVMGPGGSILETVLVPLDLAGAAVQWARPSGSRAELALTLEWSVACPGVTVYAHELVENGVVLSAVDATKGERPTALALLHPRPARVDVRPETNGVRISVHVTSGTSEPVTLFLAGGESAKDTAGALRSLTQLRAHERRAEHATLEAQEDNLSVDSGGPLDDALEWAKARTRAAVKSNARGRRIRRGGAACTGPRGGTADRDEDVDSPFAPATDAAWVALGALASGNPEPAEVLLEGEPRSAYELLVAARYAAWSGQSGALLRHRAAVEALGQRLSSGRVRADPVLRAAGRELSDVWDSVDRTLAKRLRSAAAAASTVSSARTLPMAGRSEEEAGAGDEWWLLRALFDERPPWYRTPTSHPGRAVVKALRAWGLCRAGDAEQGHLELLGHASAGFDLGVGLWQEHPGEGGGGIDHAASAALLPAALLFGVLGAAADAPVGRVRLAPRLSSLSSRISVTGIRVGDARLRLDYDRTGSEHRFVVTQETGRLPLMLVFEPEVPEKELLEVRIDGSAAQLNLLARAGRTSTRVQLPLDAPRRVTLVGRGPA